MADFSRWLGLIVHVHRLSAVIVQWNHWCRVPVSPQCTKYAFGLRAKYAWVPDGDLASEYLMSFDSPPKPDKFRNLEANTDTILSFIKEWMIYLTDSDRDQ